MTAPDVVEGFERGEDKSVSVGGLDGLENQKADLLAEIDDLRERRQPLVPDTRQGEFLCTGSMNPVITCMD